MTIQDFNQLLTTSDINNYKLAFQEIIRQKEFFEEGYLMICWALKNINYSSMGAIAELELNAELLKIKDMITQSAPAFKKKLSNCNKALNLFYIDIGWEEASNIKAALKSFEPFRIGYEAILEKILVQPYLFIVRKAATALVVKGLNPYYQHLIKYDALEIQDKKNFSHLK